MTPAHIAALLACYLLFQMGVMLQNLTPMFCAVFAAGALWLAASSSGRVRQVATGLAVVLLFGWTGFMAYVVTTDKVRRAQPTWQAVPQRP
jgi:FtsH-binding integral membrane protein